MEESGVRDQTRCRHLVRHQVGAMLGLLLLLRVVWVTGATMVRTKSDFELKDGTNDMVGLVMLEIQGADDLPRLANSAFFYQ